MGDYDYLNACVDKDYHINVADDKASQTFLANLSSSATQLCDVSGRTCYNIPAGGLYCDESNSNNPLDFVVVTLIIIAVLPFIAANLAMLYHRQYRPIRAKGVDVTITSSIGGLIWIWATLVVNNHFRRHRDTFWSLCNVWTFWMQLHFGFSLWLCCLIVRLYRLYCLFKLTKKSPKHMWVPLGVLLLPVFIFCIFASSFTASRFRHDNCEAEKTWAVAALIIVPSYFLLMFSLAYSLRDIRDEFNEYRSIRTGGIMAFALFFLGMVTLTTKTYQEVTGRAFMSLAVSAEVFYYFWARNGFTIWQACFNNKPYAREFEASLRNKGGLAKSAGKLEDLDASTVAFVEPDTEHTGDYKVADSHDGPAPNSEADVAPIDLYSERSGMSYNELKNCNTQQKARIHELEVQEAVLKARVAELESEVARRQGSPYEQRIDVSLRDG